MIHIDHLEISPTRILAPPAQAEVNDIDDVDARPYPKPRPPATSERSRGEIVFFWGEIHSKMLAKIELI